MFRRTPPRPLRPTVGNTVGLTTRFSGSYPISIKLGRGGDLLTQVNPHLTDNVQIRFKKVSSRSNSSTIFFVAVMIKDDMTDWCGN